MSDTTLGRKQRALGLDRLPLANGGLLAVEAPEDPVVIDGDRVGLRRALHNLVGNAVNYSPAGTPVAVTVSARDALAVVAVRDRGVGIPAAELPRIFERFFRASTAGAVAGTGLGLYGAKAIVEQHGGTIVVESVAGAGTTVTLTLPLVPPGLPEHSAGA